MAEHTPARNERGRPSPLHACHVARAAQLVSFAGWLMPLRYTSELEEHRAVRQAAGLFDLSHMAEIECHGPQAGTALDYALVGAISGLSIGQARYTMLCAHDGGVLDDLVVYRVAGERFLVVANAANAAVVHAGLVERADSYDAKITDHSTATALVALQGPLAEGVLAPLCDVKLAEIGNYRCAQGSVLGEPALIARTGYTGEDGFELFVDAAAGARLFEELAERGAPAGVIPAGLAARDSLRLEAGMPLYGQELSAERTPYEAGLGRVVRLDKPGDFVGKAALQRRHDEGVREVLVGLSCPRPPSPRAGMAVHRFEDGEPGARLGVVTSGAPSPSLGHPIAMGYLAAEAATSATPLAVVARSRATTVELTALPFYRRQRATSEPRPGGTAKEEA